MCEDGLHDPFTDQVECARFRAERDMLAQAMERVSDDIERTFLGFEGAEDAPAMRWARQFRAALGSLHAPVRDTTMSAYDLLPADEREAIAWVREHGGLDSVKKLLDWVVGHCSTKQQLDFDFWLSGRVMHELGFDEDMADRDEVERRLLARLMPDGMEWPRFESGEPVRIGDVVSDVEVRSVVFRDDGILLSDCTSVPGWGTWRSYKEPIKRPAPKVLDADGEEILVGDTVYRVGMSTFDPEYNTLTVTDIRTKPGLTPIETKNSHDGYLYGKPEDFTHRAPVLAADGKPLREGEHVYHVETGAELVVKELPKPGEYQAVVVFAPPASHLTSFDPDQLTHERPESKCRDCQYWQKDPTADNMGVCWFFYHEHEGQDCYAARRADIGACEEFMPRAKALAGVS